MTIHVGAPVRGSERYQIKLVDDPASLAQAEDIWALSFGKGWARDYAHKELSRIFGAFDDDKLHAVAAVIDYEVTFADKVVPCGGLAAVATAPGQRYQNLVRMLLTESVREMHSRQVPLAALYPFSYPFYERMGWAATHWQYKIETDITWLRNVGQKGDARRFRMVHNSNCQEILPVYDKWSAQFNLALSRWHEKLRSMIFWPNSSWRIFVHDHGYMLWDLARSQGNELFVAEFAYLNEAAFRDGLALLAQMDSQFEKVTWIDSDAEPFLQLGLPQPKPIIHKAPAMMSRVVNVEAFAKLLPEPLTGLRVSDPLGVSGDKVGDIGVGELLQLVTGFWQKPPQQGLKRLHNIAGGKPAFCMERY